ncbi:helix-turn-helix domain-containing protein [Burkholderia ubonensis]|uniref:helix-turn-helix domain-containing protein n=1 Tax=Burkholderia ubonensis TaxID=101571 RepID=UPI000753819B|nr:helix-turn-helix domain-containing protein [Burkholderia ubonensis]KVO87678.1 hypothetical protein WJ81_15630 [Burkholderia ubonensis]KVZ57295.1 hypothetical protein WL20_23415 [Burkholderia ubonensis]
MGFIAVSELAVMQAFIDAAFADRRSGACTEDPIEQVDLFLASKAERSNARTWLLREALADSTDYRRVARRLRGTEVYGMISFLLFNDGKLGTLVSQYGISSAHFRRLFGAAVGRSPKSVTKQWRLAKAVLSIVDGRRSVTDAAMELGYASSSHLSSDFRAAVGKSLTQLLDLRKQQQGRSSEVEDTIHSVLSGDPACAAAAGRAGRRAL